MTSGFIKIHRKILDSRVWQNPVILKVFLYCIMKATYKERWVGISTGKGSSEILLEKGQFVYGRNAAGEELNMSPSSVRNNLEKLAKWGMINVKSKTHYSIVSVVNYSDYQDINEEEGQPKDNQRTTKGQPKDNQRTQTRKYKKDKESILVLEQPANTNTKIRFITESDTNSLIRTAGIDPQGYTELLHGLHKLTANGYRTTTFPQILNVIKALQSNQVPDQAKTKILFPDYALGKVWEKLQSISTHYADRDYEMLLADSIYLNHIAALLGLINEVTPSHTGSIDEVEQEAIRYAIGHCQKQYNRESDWTPEIVFEKVSGYNGKKAYFSFKGTHKQSK